MKRSYNEIALDDDINSEKTEKIRQKESYTFDDKIKANNESVNDNNLSNDSTGNKIVNTENTTTDTKKVYINGETEKLEQQNDINNKVESKDKENEEVLVKITTDIDITNKSNTDTITLNMKKHGITDEKVSKSENDTTHDNNNSKNEINDNVNVHTETSTKNPFGLPSIFGTSVFSIDGSKENKSSIFNFEGNNNSSFLRSLSNDDENSNFGNEYGADTKEVIPTSFPGEEEQTCLFMNYNCSIKQLNKQNDNGKEIYRYNKLGDGCVKLNKDKESGKCYLIFRQQATWKILLNSPTKYISKLDKSTATVIKFMAYDFKKVSENADTCPFSFFAIKFDEPTKCKELYQKLLNNAEE